MLQLVDLVWLPVSRRDLAAVLDNARPYLQESIKHPSATSNTHWARPSGWAWFVLSALMITAAAPLCFERSAQARVGMRSAAGGGEVLVVLERVPAPAPAPADRGERAHGDAAGDGHPRADP